MSNRLLLRPAFTLVEMSCSLAVMVVLLAALVSAVSLANLTVNGTGAVQMTQRLQSADAASQMLDDLNVATSISEQGANAVTMNVPTRSSGTTPLTLRYAWDGLSGDPLTRQVGSASAATLLPSVSKFALSYQTRTLGPASAVAEQLIANYDPTGLLVILSSFDVNTNNGFSQYFLPSSLPSGATSYSITRVRLLLKSSGPADGAVYVSIRKADSQFKPLSTVLAQSVVYENALSNQYEWVDVPFSNLTGLNPLTGLCIVVMYDFGGPVEATAEYQSSLFTLLSGNYFSNTSNAGTSWSGPTSTSAACFYVYGTCP